jgi:hypothetical protein
MSSSTWDIFDNQTSDHRADQSSATIRAIPESDQICISKLFSWFHISISEGLAFDWKQNDWINGAESVCCLSHSKTRLRKWLNPRMLPYSGNQSVFFSHNPAFEDLHWIVDSCTSLWRTYFGWANHRTYFKSHLL